MLNQVRPDGFDWQIPGLREELVTALIRSLPKPLRRNFVPVPDYAGARCSTRAKPGDRPAAATTLEAAPAPADRAWWCRAGTGSWTRCPTTCGSRSGWRTAGAAVAEGKDLAAVRRQLAPQAREAVAERDRRTSSATG